MSNPNSDPKEFDLRAYTMPYHTMTWVDDLGKCIKLKIVSIGYQ